MSDVVGMVGFMGHPSRTTAKHARRAGAHRAGTNATTKVVASLALTAALGFGGIVASTSSFADSGTTPTPTSSSGSSDVDPTASPSATSSVEPSTSSTASPTVSDSSSATATRQPLTIVAKKPAKKPAMKPAKKLAKELPALPEITKGHTLGKAKSHSVSMSRASRAGRPGSKPYNFMYARTYGYLHYGWSTQQYVCLRKVWAKESNWRTMAHNRRSGAYGIPQAMPGRKMANEGRDWKTNAATQIRWGLKYIKGAYGTPCHALYTRSMRGWY